MADLACPPGVGVGGHCPTDHLLPVQATEESSPTGGFSILFFSKQLRGQPSSSPFLPIFIPHSFHPIPSCPSTPKEEIAGRSPPTTQKTIRRRDRGCSAFCSRVVGFIGRNGAGVGGGDGGQKRPLKNDIELYQRLSEVSPFRGNLSLSIDS